MTEAMREGFVDGPRGRTWYKVVGEGEAIPLVTVHGGPGATHDYLEPLATLADERPVLFYDQLGAGRSDTPDDVSDWSNDVIVGELERLLDALGYDRVHLLGQSWGSIIVTEYALRHPARVASLIPASPCLSVPRYAAAGAALCAELPAEVKAVLKRGDETGDYWSAEYKAAEHEFNRRHVCRIEPMPDSLRRSLEGMNHAIYERCQGPNEFVINGFHKEYDVTGRLGELTMPVLFTCGRYDEMRPEDVSWYASLTPGAELAIFEESSHVPHLEEPEGYQTVLRDFLHRAEGR